MPNFFNQISKITTNDLMIFYIFVSLAGLVVLAFLVFVILSKLKKREVDEAVIKSRAYHKALDVLESSQKKSLKIYSDSQRKAKDIIQKAYNIKTATQKETDELFEGFLKNRTSNLEKYLSVSLKEFKKVLDEGTLKNVQTLEDMSDILKKEMLSGVDSLTDAVKKETFESQRLLDTKVEQKYHDVESELSQYKSTKLKEIDQNLSSIILEVSANTLGKSMSLKDHQDYIMKILDEEKKKINFLI